MEILQTLVGAQIFKSQTDDDLKGWAEITINTTASKYLTLLKKFGVMEGSMNKTIIHPYLSDKMFTLFIYWLIAIENSPNILNSQWIPYCFLLFLQDTMTIE